MDGTVYSICFTDELISEINKLNKTLCGRPYICDSTNWFLTCNKTHANNVMTYFETSNSDVAHHIKFKTCLEPGIKYFKIIEVDKKFIDTIQKSIRGNDVPFDFICFEGVINPIFIPSKQKLVHDSIFNADTLQEIRSLLGSII